MKKDGKQDTEPSTDHAQNHEFIHKTFRFGLMVTTCIALLLLFLAGVVLHPDRLLKLFRQTTPVTLLNCAGSFLIAGALAGVLLWHLFKLFDHVDGGLEARGGELKGFAIAGPDRVFHWAEAQIDGNTVIVWSPQVREPVAVRYGWADNPDCNLYNRAGLPASPFRTDDWPGITAGTR